MLEFKGVFAAVVTPYTSDLKASPKEMVKVLQYLKQAGAHGALLTGTNGEGPQLSVVERIAIYQAAAQAKLDDDTFTLIAGTGAVSLADTIDITKGAYDAGLLSACILPPFFFSDASEDGLFNFYSDVIDQAVPKGKPVLLYNNPRVINVSLSLSLIARLREAFPGQIIGMKDSSGSIEFYNQLRTLFPDLQILVGSDSLIEQVYSNGGNGSITGSANIYATELRNIYDAQQAGQPIREEIAAHIDRMAPLRAFPMIAMYKSVLAARGILNNVQVRPPLDNLTARQETELFELFESVTV